MNAAFLMRCSCGALVRIRLLTGPTVCNGCQASVSLQPAANELWSNHDQPEMMGIVPRLLDDYR